MEIKAVIFDLDGTLIDSMDIWVKVDHEYLTKRHIKVTPDLFEDIPEGNSFNELAHYVKEKFNLPDTIEEICQEWTAMVREHYENDIVIKPGVLSLLNFLRGKGIQMSIGTSNNFILTEAVLKRNGIRDFFQVIITGDAKLKGKPFPDIFLAAAKKMNVAPSDCLVIEDTLHGAQSALAAGMKVIAVLDKESKKDWFELEKVAIFSAKEIIEIEEFVKSLMRL